MERASLVLTVLVFGFATALLAASSGEAASCKPISDGSNEVSCSLTCDGLSGERSVHAVGVFGTISLKFIAPDAEGFSLGCGGDPDCTATGENHVDIQGFEATCIVIGKSVALLPGGIGASTVEVLFDAECHC